MHLKFSNKINTEVIKEKKKTLPKKKKKIPKENKRKI